MVNRFTLRNNRAVFLCASILLGAACAEARAGGYVISSQSGGTAVWPLRIDHYGYNPDGSGGATEEIRAFGQYGPVSFSGEIKTVFVWHPNQIIDPATGNMIDDAADTPPASVVIQETCSAQSANTDASQDLGKVDNGLHSPATRYKVPFDYGFNGGDGVACALGSSGTRCQIKSGGPTFTITCSPSLSNNPFAGNWQSQIYYRVIAFPVTLILSGVTDFGGAHNILIGQGTFGALNVDLGILINPHWSVSGETFASYDVYTNVAGGDRTAAVRYLTANDLQQLEPHWYWKKDESVTVTATADLCVPKEMISGSSGNNSGGGGGGDDTRAAQQVPPPGYAVLGKVSATMTVSVQAPDYSMAETKGVVTINNTCVGAGDFSADGIVGDGAQGMTIDGRARTPDAYWITNGVATGDAGYIAFFQLIDRDWQVSYGLFQQSKTTNGQYELDAQAPYCGLHPATSSNDHKKTQPLEFGDSPEIWFPPRSWRVAATDNFQVWLMYIPPGQDSSWVPLGKMSWGWNANADWSASSQLWNPNPPGQVWESPDTRTTQFPIWYTVYNP